MENDHEEFKKYLDIILELLKTCWMSGKGIKEFEIGRAHVWTPVTWPYLVCRLLLEKKKNKHIQKKKKKNIIKTKKKKKKKKGDVILSQSRCIQQYDTSESETCKSEPTMTRAKRHKWVHMRRSAMKMRCYTN